MFQRYCGCPISYSHALTVVTALTSKNKTDFGKSEKVTSSLLNQVLNATEKSVTNFVIWGDSQEKFPINCLIHLKKNCLGFLSTTRGELTLLM